MKILNNCPYRQKADTKKRKLTRWFDINNYFICFLDGKGCMPEIDRRCPRDTGGGGNEN